MWHISYTSAALKAMRRLSATDLRAVRKKLEVLAQNPLGRNTNVKKLVGRDGYRLRVGDVRVIYQLENDQLVVLVLDVGYRGGIYR